ncbi:Protein of unknown function [Gryllus bimaculatus]|nr:Protein of unknown function [Gryllus bimaculatus]
MYSCYFNSKKCTRIVADHLFNSVIIIYIYVYIKRRVMRNICTKIVCICTMFRLVCRYILVDVRAVQQMRNV